MCFSATASLVSGLVVGGIGIATLRFVRNRRDLMFAAVPMLFAIQQIIEGGVWLGLERDDARWTSLAVHSYTAVSHVLWPVWIPLAVLLQEPSRARRRTIIALAAVGGIVGLTFVITMATGDVSAHIVRNSIVYEVPTPVPGLHAMAYIVATCGSCLVSSRRWIVAFGILLLVSAGIAYPLYRESFASVWCFFAAFLGLIVAGHFWRQARQATAPPTTARASP